MITVRHALPSDYQTMQRFGARFHEYMGYTDMPYDAESVLFWFDAMREHGCCLVAEIGGELVAMAGGIYSKFVFNKNFLIGQEIMWWVEPEHRSIGIGGQLLAKLEECAYAAGCSRWAMIALHGTEQYVGKLYESAGYVATEHTFTKVAPWLHSSLPPPSLPELAPTRLDNHVVPETQLPQALMQRVPSNDVSST